MGIVPKERLKTVPVAKPLIFPFSYKVKCLILCLVCFIFYANSIPNKYAFDDNITIETNAYVQMGFSGIPKIMTNDSYASFYTYLGGDPSRQLSGGRFRPLSEIIFAIEQQLFGDSTLLPHFRHFINIVAYMACIIALFYFLERILLKKVPGGSDMAFVAALLFAIHPLHTEVVANIKSLDEILSMFFIMLTFIFSFKYLKSYKTKDMIIGAGSFLLAMLSKEYAVTLIFFIPFLFYLLEGKNPVSAILAAVPYYIAFIVYLVLRYNAVGFHNNASSADLVSNPYFHATHIQKAATEWFVLGKYIGLLFLPYPLSADYSYNQISNHNFSDISVMLSIVIYITILIWGISLLQKKSVLSFAVFFFLLNIFMISNFVLDIGATMGERLVFHSSLGLVIVLSYYLVKAISTMSLPAKRSIIIGVMSVITLICFGETVIRNVQWMDDTSLFIHDAGVVPRSFLVNSNAGVGYMRLYDQKENSKEQSRADLDSARKYLKRALQHKPDWMMLPQVVIYINLGDVYLYQGFPDSAQYCWDMAEKLKPDYPGLRAKYNLLPPLYSSLALSLGIKNGKPLEAIVYFRKALLIDSTNGAMWDNIGGAYFTVKQYDSARYAWMKALQYQPGNSDAKSGLQALSQIK